MNIKKMINLFSETYDFISKDKFATKKWKGVTSGEKDISAGLQ